MSEKPHPYGAAPPSERHYTGAGSVGFTTNVQATPAPPPERTLTEDGLRELLDCLQISMLYTGKKHLSNRKAAREKIFAHDAALRAEVSRWRQENHDGCDRRFDAREVEFQGLMQSEKARADAAEAEVQRLAERQAKVDRVYITTVDELKARGDAAEAERDRLAADLATAKAALREIAAEERRRAPFALRRIARAALARIEEGK